MSVQREADFGVSKRHIPGGVSTPHVERLDLINNGMVIGFDIRRSNSSGLLVIGQQLKVETGNAGIEFQSAASASEGEAPALRRSVVISFSQNYPRPDSEKPSKLPNGKFTVTMSDRERRPENGVQSADTEIKPDLHITSIRHDAYSTVEQTVAVDRGRGQYPAYELVTIPSNPEEVLVDTGEPVVTYRGGERIVHEGFDPLALNSELIGATLEAARQFASKVRGAIEEARPELQFKEISSYTGPFARSAPNLLDAFTLRAAG